jgi:hypothetical protein
MIILSSFWNRVINHIVRLDDVVSENQYRFDTFINKIMQRPC